MAINDGEAEGQLMMQLTELRKTLKEGEKILAPTRRPDGTLRKAIRIRAGYVPQEEVAKYQSKGALLKKEQASQTGPPGYEATLDTKPKSKSVKRNGRKKEKRLQAALQKEKNTEQTGEEDSSNQEVLIKDSGHTSDSVISLTSQLNELVVSGDPSIVTPTSETVEGSDPVSADQDIDKRIRALKKKIRLTEALQQKTADMKPEQLDKLAKLEDWRKELKLLEDKKAETIAS